MPSQKLGIAMPSTATVPGRAVEDVAAVERRDHAERDADQPSPSSSAQGMIASVFGSRSRKRLDRRLAHADRGAEIAVQRVADEDQELLDRAARRGPSALISVRAVLGRGVLGQHQIDRVAGQPAEKEHDRRHHEQQHDALQSGDGAM